MRATADRIAVEGACVTMNLAKLHCKRGLKNKPKIRYLHRVGAAYPIFRFFFNKQGPRGAFRALRSATNGLPLDRKKLLKKFYQNFQRGVQLRPSNSDLLVFFLLIRSAFTLDGGAFV
ncbi:MAG: hypothetical protein IJX46_06115 [Clostridia bacterium]|nr:hypothetical protein [Clostridia bacterium]